MMNAARQVGAPHTVWQKYLSDNTLAAVLKSPTPACVYSEQQILDNCAVYQTAVGARVANFRYAVKACPLAPVLRAVASVGWGADCQSVMEAELALAAGIAPEKISLCSPRLNLSAVDLALDKGIILIADSPEQMALIAACLEQRPAPAGWHFGSRLSLDVAGTERFHSKLGMELTDVVQSLDHFPSLRAHFDEIHHHGLARESKDTIPTAIAASMIRALGAIEPLLGRCVRYINFGGGFEPESLLCSQHSVTTADLLTNILHSFDSLVPGATNNATDTACASSPLVERPDQILVFEPGRAITKDAAIAITTVTNTKHLRGANIAVVDVSTNLLIPLPLAEFSVDCLDDLACENRTWDIVDGTCSPAGVVARKASLPELKPGARLIVNNAGAYTWSLCEPFYDLLPQLWWIDRELNVTCIFGKEASRAWTRSVWSYEP